MDSVRHTLRSLLRSPVYTAAAIGTLGLALGANAVVYAFASAVFVRPLPFADEGRLVAILTTHRGPDGRLADGLGAQIDFVRFAAQSRTLQNVGAMAPAVFSIARDDRTEAVDGANVSASMWEVLGTKPVAGRLYDNAEDQPLATSLVISERLQRRYFPGSAANALGRQLLIDGRRRVIIGVMPVEFSPLMQPGDLWAPLGLSAGTINDLTGTRLHLLAGRMKPGVSLVQIDDDLGRIARDMASEMPATHAAYGAHALALREVIGGSTRTMTLLLSAFVFVLLLLACANVANLSLARVTQRSREIATRLALGATPRAIVTRQMLEGMMLGIAGGLLGIVLATVSLPVFLALVPDAPRVLELVRFDVRSGIGVGIGAIVSGVLVTAGPAFVAVRSAAATAFGGGRSQSFGVRERRLHQLLMLSQVAAATLLLASSIGIAVALHTVGKANVGMDVRDVVVARLTLPEDRYPDLDARTLFVDRVVDQLLSTPGISKVGVTHNRFVAGQSLQTIVRVEGETIGPSGDLALAFRRVTPALFGALGIHALRGRLFESTDRVGQPSVTIVSQSFVRRYFGTADPLGRRIQRQGGTLPWMTIVGVVPDVMDAGVGVDLGPMIYIPYDQNSSPRVTFVVKSTLPVASIDRLVRSAVRSADAGLPVSDVSALDDMLSNSLEEQRLKSTVLATLAALAIILASTGIYGVTAFLTTSRSKEVAIRLALGAVPSRIRTQLIVDASAWILGGVAIGLSGAWVAGAIWRARAPELHEAVGGVYLATAVTLIAVALLAVWMPTYRAADTPAVRALRELQ